MEFGDLYTWLASPGELIPVEVATFMVGDMCLTEEEITAASKGRQGPRTIGDVDRSPQDGE
jgi:hypothetical protein